jgi:pimeloyl-ACP methyl ester carboxylesterase
LNRLHVRAELPTLAIWGEDDQIIPVEHGHAAMAARPGGRLEVLPGVGHFAHVEAPNDVAELIDDFMRSTKQDTGVDVVHPPSNVTEIDESSDVGRQV